MTNKKEIEEYADDILKSVARISGISLGEITEHMSRSKVILENILAEAKKTNGRIAKLEEESDILSRENAVIKNEVSIIKDGRDASRKISDKWMDRIWNTVFIGGLTVIFWVLIATGIIKPPL